MDFDLLKKYLLEDKHGKIVIAQPPNIPVYVMLVSVIGKWLTKGAWVNGFDLLFFGAACTWSYMEIRYGASGIRRVFGAVVLIAAFATRLMH